MAASVEQYVLGCDRCQRYKSAPHPKSVLQPQPAPERPWENVGIDLITQLPASQGFEAIAVIVDHYSDQVHLVPTHNTLTAEGTQDIYYKDVFRLHGLPRKIYSDRGPQFAARVMRALYKRLGIESGITTAYHPEGNGKVERKNQEVETFLRLFCAKRQDDWADHLPAAEFALNSRIHSATGKSPFELIYGYCPDFTFPVGRRSSIDSLEARLDRMAKARDDAAAALRLTKEKMKEDYEKGKRKAHQFDVGDLVALSAKDIKIHQQTPKLGPRQLGPFKVLERIGELDYRLDLPDWLKIHPVIHVNRLSPWHDNGIVPPPPPDPVIVDGEEEWEIEQILDSRFSNRSKRTGLQYLVRWKGYGEGDDLWIPAKEFHANEAIADFHRSHPTTPPNDSTPRRGTRRINATSFATAVTRFHQQQNSAAPRKLTGISYIELNRHFVPLETTTSPDQFASWYPATFDLGWEDGKYLGCDIS